MKINADLLEAISGNVNKQGLSGLLRLDAAAEKLAGKPQQRYTFAGEWY